MERCLGLDLGEKVGRGRCHVEIWLVSGVNNIGVRVEVMLGDKIIEF